MEENIEPETIREDVERVLEIIRKISKLISVI